MNSWLLRHAHDLQAGSLCSLAGGTPLHIHGDLVAVLCHPVGNLAKRLGDTPVPILAGMILLGEETDFHIRCFLLWALCFGMRDTG